jgi:hypothetical protein
MADWSEYFEMVDRLRTFPKETRSLIIDLAGDVTDEAVLRAKSRAPVRTGAYREGIKGKPVVSRGQHLIFSGLEATAAHSSFIERGTSRMPPRPIISEAGEWAAREMEGLLGMIAEDNL